jgi:hypothetical protein
MILTHLRVLFAALCLILLDVIPHDFSAFSRRQGTLLLWADAFCNTYSQAQCDDVWRCPGPVFYNPSQQAICTNNCGSSCSIGCILV